jgi:ferric-chelate reductase (NADPH)
MPKLSRVLSSAVEKLLFHPMIITGAERIAESYSMLSVQGEFLLETKWIPGQAIEVYLGSLTKRAYTPMKLDPKTGSASFLIYLHGGGPGSAWAANVKAGDTCHALRPKNSLDFTTLSGPALFFGDETSIAAARALRHCRENSANDRYVLEVSSPPQAEIVLKELGVGNTSLVQRTEDGSHLVEALSILANHAATTPSPQWILTGQARSIQRMQRGLKDAHLNISPSKVKAYWSPGKTGMD